MYVHTYIHTYIYIHTYMYMCMHVQYVHLHCITYMYTINMINQINLNQIKWDFSGTTVNRLGSSFHLTPASDNHLISSSLHQVGNPRWFQTIWLRSFGARIRQIELKRKKGEECYLCNVISIILLNQHVVMAARWNPSTLPWGLKVSFCRISMSFDVPPGEKRYFGNPVFWNWCKSDRRWVI